MDKEGAGERDRQRQDERLEERAVAAWESHAREAQRQEDGPGQEAPSSTQAGRKRTPEAYGKAHLSQYQKQPEPGSNVLFL